MINNTETNENRIIEKQIIPFTQISNEILNSKDLSFKAKGIYAYMYSKPDGWNFTLRSMAKQVKEGKEAISKGIDELKEAGLVEYTKNNDGSGTYKFFHTFEREEPDPENQDQPNPENPNMGKSERISNKDTNSNKDKKIKQKEIPIYYKLYSNKVKELTKEYGLPLTLPEWLIAYRKSIKHPLKTEVALIGIIKNIKACVDAGHDIGFVIEEMQEHEWRTVKLEYLPVPKQTGWSNH